MCQPDTRPESACEKMLSEWKSVCSHLRVMCVGEFTRQKLMGIGIRCKSKWSGVCECDQEASVLVSGPEVDREAWLWETLGFCVGLHVCSVTASVCEAEVLCAGSIGAVCRWSRYASSGLLGSALGCLKLREVEYCVATAVRVLLVGLEVFVYVHKVWSGMESEEMSVCLRD